MFGQLVPWYDCNNNCTFCSQKDVRRVSTDKRRRLMKAASWIESESKDYDKFGIIGGELFDDPSVNRELRCLAEALSMMKADTLFVASHLICDISGLLRFLAYLPKRKTVMVCTSYDAKGRFHSEADLELWRKNIETIHDAGYSISCTCILTQDLVEQDVLPIPDYVYTTLVEPIPSWNYWYATYNPAIDEDCRESLLTEMDGFPLRLPTRDDTLKWFDTHKDITRHYADYNDSHAGDVYEYMDGNYSKIVDDRFAVAQCECGHQYSARCYADSPKCIQCDIKEKFKW